MTAGSLAIGITAGILMGALWGFEFLVPQVLHSYTPGQIMIARYFFFGLISLVGIRASWRIFRSLSWRDRLETALLSATGFWFYTLLMIFAIQQNGGVSTTMMLGLVPVLVPLAEKWGQPLSRGLCIGLMMLLAGLCTLHLWPLVEGKGLIYIKSWAGFTAAAACPLIWTFFALRNTSFLHKHPELPRQTLTNIVGINCMAVGAVFLMITGLQDMPAGGENLTVFIFWTAVVGIGSSWLGNYFWNICSSRCPPVISGPLVVNETLFGLIYSFIYEGRFPFVHEICAISLMVAGVTVALAAESRPRESAV